MKAGSVLLSVAVAMGGLVARADEPKASVFGSAEKSGAAMIGIFYDLKQNQRRQPVQVNYLQTLGEFLDSGWDENVLSRFFRGTKPLYATDVFISTMGAGEAPAAFDLEDVVRPQSWFVIYKAQVSPPEDGTYRFVGTSDDVMAVGVNGKTVLVSHYMSTQNTSKWRQQDPSENTKHWAGELRRGDWFEAKKGEPVDLDVLIGEFPGSIFGAWLLIEKRGATYPEVDTRWGRQVALPVFQVKERKIDPKENDPPFTTDGVPWTAHP